MVSNIITYTVKDLVDLGIIEKPLDGNHGGIHPKSSDYVEYGIPFIMASDLINGHVDIKGCKFISEEQAKSLRKGFAKEGDVLLSHKATIGRTAVLGKLSTDFIVLTPQITYYRVLDLTRLNPRYLKYYFDSEGFQALFEQWAGGGSTRLYLGITEQMKLPIELPEIKIQNKIVDFVDSFDRKITLNRQINQTLEQMAQALFKSWFVDFDPVVDNALDAGFFEQDLEFSDELLRRAEARKAVRESVDFKPLPEHIRQLFPAAFEKCSEPSLGLGSWVPEGWKGLSIKSHCAKIQNGGTPSRSNPEYWDDGNIPWLTSGEVRQSIITSVENTITEIGLQNSSAKWVGARSTLVALYGATAGEVSINSDPLTTNQAVCALIPKENYCWLNYLQIRNKTIEMQNNAVGSAQQNISKGLVENLIVISPPLSIVEIFHQKTESLFVKAIANHKMVIEVARLRDTLLPKLISGELRLSGSEVDTAEEVLA